MANQNSRRQWIENAKVIYHPEWIRRWRKDPFSVPPIYIEVSPVGMCNHRCTFCAPEMLGYPNRSLDADLLITRLTEMKEARERDPDGLGVKSIQYAGEGEPTLHKDLPRIFEATREAGIDVGMLTNATGLTEKMVRGLVPHINGYLQASVNAGTGESYAKIHRTDTKHWDLVWRNLERAVKLKREFGASECDIGANMTVLIEPAWDPELKQMTPSNWPEIELLARRARDAGLDYVSFKPYSQHPHSEETFKMYGNMSYGDMMDEIHKIGERVTAELSSDSFEVIFRLTRFHEYEAEDCGYKTCQSTPTIWSYIMSDGVWLTCSSYWVKGGADPRFVLGNINNQTFEEIWFGQERRKQLDFVLGRGSFIGCGLDISECRKTCHPDKDNRFLNSLIGISDDEFDGAMAALASNQSPKRKNFI